MKNNIFIGYDSNLLIGILESNIRNKKSTNKNQVYSCIVGNFYYGAKYFYEKLSSEEKQDLIESFNNVFFTQKALLYLIDNGCFGGFEFLCEIYPKYIKNKNDIFLRCYYRLIRLKHFEISDNLFLTKFRSKSRIFSMTLLLILFKNGDIRNFKFISKYNRSKKTYKFLLDKYNENPKQFNFEYKLKILKIIYSKIG